MSFGAHKADLSSYPTPLASAFAALLPALARHNEAEREIEDVAIRDPAFRNWLTDAEDAFTTVTTPAIAGGYALCRRYLRRITDARHPCPS